MTIKFTGKYKSLTGFEWTDIPKFAVITGTNGTGKSQLLDLVNDTILNNRSQPLRLQILGDTFKGSEISFIKSEWTLSNTSPVSVFTIQQEIRGLYTSFQRPQEQNNPRIREAFDSIRQETGKTGKQVSEDEFLKHFPPYLIQSDNLMSQQIGKIFLDYRLSLTEAKAEGLTEESFVLSNGEKPWIVLNDIIEESKLPFRFNNPEEEKVGFKGIFQFKIMAKESGDVINFQDLSSGEKVLVSLVFYLYNSQEKKLFPRILLLDEPDAHLHPSMTKQFINVINNVLVNKYNVRVIMTTHSPSTVALAPDDSLFVMSRVPPRISKANSKNKAISLLTAGLVFVGEGTRYILVEDEDDVEFYTESFSHLVRNNFISGDIPIVFIPASTTEKSGGKTVVQDWIKKLNDSGLTTIIQGLIDRDENNLKSDGIHIVDRYSFENYLLDPMLVYSVLLDKENAPSIGGIYLKLGDEYKLNTMNAPQLQSIADAIHSLIEPNLKNIFPDFDDNEKSKVKVDFVSGLKLHYPKWLIDRRGKTLMNLYRSQLGNFINLKELSRAFRKLHFITNDLKETFVKIQSE